MQVTEKLILNKIKKARRGTLFFAGDFNSITNSYSKAMKNKAIFDDIRTHREKFNAIKGIDYNKHSPENTKFIPPDKLLPLWEKDYRQMQENMIYGSSLPFSDLIESLKELQNRINAL